MRHMIYHIAPVSGNDGWRWNVEQLGRRLDRFDGRRLVGIVQGEGLDPAELVQQALGPSCQYLIRDNDKATGEVVTLQAGLQILHGAEGHLWYGHAKGVSPHNQGDRAFAVRRWAQVSYESTLDYLPLVERRLVGHVTAGSFRRIGVWAGPPLSRWHYAGTYYWTRLKDLWATTWSVVGQHYGGVEAWPGTLWNAGRAAVLFMHMQRDTSALYERRHWQNIFDPLWRIWQKDHAADKMV